MLEQLIDNGLLALEGPNLPASLKLWAPTYQDHVDHVQDTFNFGATIPFSNTPVLLQTSLA